ncbi:MAG: hypothetical protein GF381_02380 [Candidatus Pacebacteria bacterium]|nr:hypothetical protein [Candidatus Paceibacterota bacterium]
MNLPAICSEQDAFSILELDQIPQLASWLGLELKHQANIKLIRKLLDSLVTDLSAQASGLVLDPIYSLDAIAAKAARTGTLLRLTALQEQVDPLATPVLIPHWSVEDIENNYSLAKLELYYHPAEQKALEKKQLVAELADYCDYLDIDFVLKLVVYTPADREYDQTEFQADQLQAIEEFRSFVDLFALQDPQTPLAAATITAELDQPWVLYSQGQEYEQYKEVLRICLENGASGYWAGDSLWQEIAQFKQQDQSPDLEKINQFIATTVRDRVIELTRIADELGSD